MTAPAASAPAVIAMIVPVLSPAAVEPAAVLELAAVLLPARVWAADALVAAEFADVVLRPELLPVADVPFAVVAAFVAPD